MIKKESKTTRHQKPEIVAVHSHRAGIFFTASGSGFEFGGFGHVYPSRIAIRLHRHIMSSPICRDSLPMILARKEMPNMLVTKGGADPPLEMAVVLPGRERQVLDVVEE